MPDEFTQIRDAMIENSRKNGIPKTRTAFDETTLLLENQRVICATLALLVRGGHAPIQMARDLQDRAKKISKILEGG